MRIHRVIHTKSFRTHNVERQKVIKTPTPILANNATIIISMFLKDAGNSENRGSGREVGRIKF